MNRAILIAAAALIVGAACMPTSGVLADQVQDDAVLAEELFERGRKAKKIAHWARDRAQRAIMNTPTFVAKIAACHKRADGLPDGDTKKRTVETCDEMIRKRSILKEYKDEVDELSTLFIIERLQEEREQVRQDLLDAVRRQLAIEDGSII